MTWESGERPIEILLVEDDPADARLTEETLKGAEHQTNITLAEDGEIAMARLRKQGEYESPPRPDLILLDMKMPGMDGPEVLAQLSGDADLASIPVMILTGPRQSGACWSPTTSHPAAIAGSLSTWTASTASLISSANSAACRSRCRPPSLKGPGSHRRPINRARNGGGPSASLASAFQPPA